MVNDKMFDDVNGQIIGTHYGQCWITYRGRKQGPTHYARNEGEATQMCDAEVARIKSDCGQAFRDIYPAKDAWQYHFDNL